MAARRKDTLAKHLEAVAQELTNQITLLGGDPLDPSEVADYVKGCRLEQKLVRLILVTADDE